MVGKDMPLEADCDICGQPLEPGEISRNHHRQSGNLTCEYCSHIKFNKHHEYDE